MSTKCVRCGCWRRDGIGLMCIDCNQAAQIVQAINILRYNEGASVLICCENPEGTGPDNHAVDVTDAWTNWQPFRFEGRTLLAALTNAVMDKVEKDR